MAMPSIRAQGQHGDTQCIMAIPPVTYLHQNNFCAVAVGARENPPLLAALLPAWFEPRPGTLGYSKIAIPRWHFRDGISVDSHPFAH